MPVLLPSPLRGLLDRLPRTVTLRRVTAAVLVVVAAVLALRPTSDGEDVVIAARTLAAGTTLAATDLRTVRMPRELVPVSALRAPAEALGGVLAGAAAAGEAITRARLVGPENTRLTGGPGTAAVAVRLADPAVIGLLRPGARVDVVTTDDVGGGTSVLARDARVLVVRKAEADRASPREDVVLLALTRDSATEVAAVSLGGPVAVTLR